jgi:Flp pilus assembly protein TadG
MRTSESREGQKGQAVVLFAILLVVMIGAAGLLVDGGMAWANRRQAQSAADLSALAAAKAISDGGYQCNATGKALAQSAAGSVAGFNGFNSVQVEYPATSGGHTGCMYVRVTVSRPMKTTFSRIMGQDTWTPTASAVAALVQNQGAAGAKCTFCSLNTTNDNHTLLVQVGSTLIVDGDIYVNSSNGRNLTDPTSAIKLKDWYAGGDGFDIFGTGGRIQANHISVVGGWETHDGGIAIATSADCPASERPDPPAYAKLVPPIYSNVCLHQNALADPLAGFPAPAYADYPIRSLKQIHYGGSLTYNILPGIYIGGIKIDGTAIVNMAPGMYYMAAGGFLLTGSGAVVGTGVTIYSGSPVGQTGKAGPVDIDTNGKVVLTPPTSGLQTGMTIFVERASHVAVTLQPANAVQCASTAAAGQPQGCIGGISGTIYAAHQDSVVTVSAAGTANLQILSGRMLVTNGSTARFTFNSAGFASSSVSISLVE